MTEELNKYAQTKRMANASYPEIPLTYGADVLTVDCTESKGIVSRTVREFPLSIKNIQALYVRASRFPTLFGQEGPKDFPSFLQILMHEEEKAIRPNGLMWAIDDLVGIFYLSDIQAGTDANIHFSFFDQRLRGRLQLCRRMVQLTFEQFKFRRLTIELPEYIRGNTPLFVEQLGFQREGCKRLATTFANRWFNVRIYGMLYEERPRYQDINLDIPESGDSNGRID